MGMFKGLHSHYEFELIVYQSDELDMASQEQTNFSKDGWEILSFQHFVQDGDPMFLLHVKREVLKPMIESKPIASDEYHTALIDFDESLFVNGLENHNGD